MRQDYTGERFLPDVCQGEIAIEHEQRYQFAKRLTKGKTVLDAACGEGYGSSLLAQDAEAVVGLDLDEETVRRAKQKYGNKKLDFRVGTIARLPFADGSFDAVVSFETIEHVGEETQKAFLHEIRRVLKKDGLMILSTPNRAVYTDLVKGQNPFHVKEFYAAEYREFLSGYFKETELFCQYPDLGYFIAPEGGSVCIPRGKGKRAEESRYLIAVCRDAEEGCGADPEGLAVFDDQMYYELNRAVHEKETQIRNLKEEAEAFQCQLEQGISEQKAYIAKLETDLSALRAAYEDLTKHPLRSLIKKIRRK